VRRCTSGGERWAGSNRSGLGLLWRVVAAALVLPYMLFYLKIKLHYYMKDLLKRNGIM
jgi:hypothetical protein